jgi:hypothetical protein
MSRKTNVASGSRKIILFNQRKLIIPGLDCRYATRAEGQKAVNIYRHVQIASKSKWALSREYRGQVQSQTFISMCSRVVRQLFGPNFPTRLHNAVANFIRGPRFNPPIHCSAARMTNQSAGRGRQQLTDKLMTPMVLLNLLTYSVLSKYL